MNEVTLQQKYAREILQLFTAVCTRISYWHNDMNLMFQVLNSSESGQLGGMAFVLMY